MTIDTSKWGSYDALYRKHRKHTINDTIYCVLYSPSLWHFPFVINCLWDSHHADNNGLAKNNYILFCQM